MKKRQVIEKVEYSKQFQEDYKKSSENIKRAFRDSLDLFLFDPHNPFLRNHALREEYKGYRSIDVTGDWRAVFREFQQGSIIIFELLRTHERLYKNKLN